MPCSKSCSPSPSPRASLGRTGVLSSALHGVLLVTACAGKGAATHTDRQHVGVQEQVGGVEGAVAPTAGADRDPFFRLGSFSGVGKVLSATVAPDTNGERVWLSYVHSGKPLEIVSVDPETGAHRVFVSPVGTETAGWSMALGPDGRIYVGTTPGGRLLRIDPATGDIRDMGALASGEQYVWELDVGADGRLYGCTYPSAKLVRFDPVSEQAEDLGRMDSTEMYARSLVTTDDGFVYVGIGTARARVVAYEIATGRHRELSPRGQEVSGTARVFRGVDGRVYARIGERQLRLSGWRAIPVKRIPEPEPLRLRDGRNVRIPTGDVIEVVDMASGNVTERPYAYAGKGIDVFRLGLGPDDMLYGSTLLPLHLFRMDPEAGGIETLGRLGDGEVYAFARSSDRLLAATYWGDAPLLSYDPRASWTPGHEGNPRLLDQAGLERGWRPMAILELPGPALLLGGQAGYGRLGGGLARWDLATDRVEIHAPVIRNQSIVSLTMTEGKVVAGTDILGGGGSHPEATEAHLVFWDPMTKTVLEDIVPVPGAARITNLVTAADGRVYGVADQATMFVVDPESVQVVHQAPLPFETGKGMLYNAMAVGPDGNPWGLAREGIFTIDRDSFDVRLVATPPEPVTAGFVLHRGRLYYASGPTVWRYDLPDP